MDDTAQAQKLLAAKKGKASTGGDIAASNLGEQQAVAQTNQQMMGNVAPEAAVQQAELGEEAAGQQASQQNQEAQIAQGRQFNALQNNIQTTSLLNNLSQSKGKLDMENNSAQLNQVAQGLRLQNQDYISNLQKAGDMGRLTDQNAFADAMAQDQLGDNKDLLEKQLGDKSILNASARDFSKAMANMDIDAAWQMINNSIASQKTSSNYAAGGTVLQSGIAAYGKSQEAPATPAAAPEEEE